MRHREEKQSDRALLEELRMKSTTEARTLAHELIWTLKRSGFMQLRKTSNGYLYGSGTARFELPYAVVQGSASISMLQELAERFARVRAERDATFGSPKPVVLEPVPNPEDLLEPLARSTEGPPVADAGTVSPAGAGSTPVPSASSTEAARPEPGPPKIALEGSTPSGLPTPTPQEEDPQEDPMARAKVRKPYDGVTCEKCGKHLKHWGRHATACPGKRLSPAHPAVKAEKLVTDGTLGVVTRRKGRHVTVVVQPSLNGYQEIATAFEKATADMLNVLKALSTEAEVYKRERDELAAWKQHLSGLFGR